MLLSKLHATAVDFPKTGICPSTESIKYAKEWPDFMERDENLTKARDTVLGRLYREAKNLIKKEEMLDIDGKQVKKNKIQIDKDFIIEGYQVFLKEAFGYLD